MKVTKTYPRFLVRWRGNCWEIHLIGNRLVQPSDGSLIGVVWTWQGLKSWIANWKVLTYAQDPSDEYLSALRNKAYLKRMSATYWKHSAWRENQGGMHCPK